MRPAAAMLLVSILLHAAEFRTPAATRPASAKLPDIVLPGGRLLTPPGELHYPGPGPFGLALSPDGNTLVSSDGGPNRYSLTILTKSPEGWKSRSITAPRKGEKEAEEDDWRSVFMGLAFENNRLLYASEGNSGRVRLIDVTSGKRIATIDLNNGGYQDSYTGDLAFDAARNLLYVVDQANFRVAVIDTRRRAVLSSLKVGRIPFAVALEGSRVWVTHIGMFEYQALPGASKANARETGLPFPAFGFPSPEAERGVVRSSAAGAVQVPGLGPVNARESNSVAVVDFTDPAQPKIETFLPTGKPYGNGIHGGSSPSGIAIGGGRAYVSNAHNDSITVIDLAARRVEREIDIRIPGLESYRGVMPIGLALAGDRLYVAEAGINAVGVIDTGALQVLGHLPAAWFPTRALIRDGLLYVSSAKGTGTGPNANRDRAFSGDLRRGAITISRIPTDLAAATQQVMANNGFLPAAAAPAAVPPALRHAVIIVKENRTFDEVFGDIAGRPDLARFGSKVTPNHHAIAQRWAYSQNFYCDSEVSVDGHHWLAGVYPDVYTQSTLMSAYGGQKDFRLPTTAPGRLLYPGSNSSVHPEEQLEAGTLWHHLERHGISFRNFGEGFELAGIDEGQGLKPTGARVLTNVPMPDPLFRNTSRNYPGYNMNIPDQYRATQMIDELKTVKDLPRLIFVHLPNDHIADPRPEDGYPTRAAFVADNDYALGRIVEYLSSRPEWKSMAVFITEDDPAGGVDHVDSHRSILMMAGPWIKPGCVSRENVSFSGMLKTVYRVLGIPPMTLFDAAATDLAGCFTSQPDFSGYRVREISKSVFDPAKAREPLDPKPSPRMDDPGEVKRQQRRP